MLWNCVSFCSLTVRFVARRMLETAFPVWVWVYRVYRVCVAELGVAGGVADQDDFIDASHHLMIAMACKKEV